MKTAKHFFLSALLLSSVQNGFAAEGALPAAKEADLEDATDQSDSLLPAAEVQKVKFDENEAWKQLCLAKNSKEAEAQSKAYADAVQYISAATTVSAAPPEAFLLASRIYRHKGGLSYAKNYFTRAAAVYLDEAMQLPDSIKANLKAGIILYAGDVRYWDSYEQSRKNARDYADKVLALCKKAKMEKNLSAGKAVFLEEAAALACLIKENEAESNAHFAKAEELWNKKELKTDSVLINVVGATTAGSSYLPYELFKEFPQQGIWYWQVSSQTDAAREFLLNCLTGFYMKE